MRHSRHVRHIFTALAAGLVAGVFLSATRPLPAQAPPPARILREGYRLSSAEEERLNPAVKELRDALNVYREEELASRKETLSKLVDKLRGFVELSQALTLYGWRDNSTSEDVSKIDAEVREQLAQRWIQILRDSLKSGQPVRQLAAADFLSEIGVNIRGTQGGAADTRRSLAAALGPDLANLLPGKNPDVTAAAARALGRIYPDPNVAIPALERVLQSGQVSEQRAAAEALAGLIREADQLVKTTARETPELAPPPAEVSDMGRRVVQAAARGLANSDAQVRWNCVETLLQSAIALRELVPLPGTGEEAARLQKQQTDMLPLAKALGDQGSALARRLKDRDKQVRLLAALALEEMGNAYMQFVHVMGKQKKADQEALPQDAIFRGLREALPALSESLSDPDLEVRLKSAEVLELFGSDVAPAAGALTKALADRNIFVRWASARTLSNVDPESDRKAVEIAVPGLARVLFDPDLDARLAAAATLERYGTAAKAAVPQMARAVVVGDVEIRVAVIRAIEAIEPRDAQAAIPALSSALTHPDVRVRRSAARALGRFGPLALDAESALRRALEDPDVWVRRAASAALIDLYVK